MEASEFLKQCPPFDELKSEHLSWVISQLQSVYLNEENCNDVMTSMRPALFIVRSGILICVMPTVNLSSVWKVGTYLVTHRC